MSGDLAADIHAPVLPSPREDTMAQEPTWAERELLRQLADSIEAGNADRKALTKGIGQLVELARGHETAAAARHDAMMASLTRLAHRMAEVSATVSAPRPPTRGLGGPVIDLIRATVDRPAVQTAIANGVMLAIVALAGYAGIVVTGAPVTPAPVHVITEPTEEATP